MACIKFEVPIYGGLVRVVDTPEDYLEAIEDEDNEDGDNPSDCHGITKMRHTDSGVEWTVGVFDNDLFTLIHECGHLAIYIAGHTGWAINEETGEPLAYLLETLAKLAMPILKDGPVKRITSPQLSLFS